MTALPAEVEEALKRDPTIRPRLDEAALQTLSRTPPDRAVQVVEELLANPNVRNPSAFVAAAVLKNPTARPALAVAAAGTIQELLTVRPELQKALESLDDGAMRRLAEVDVAKAAELMMELSSRPDVRNPSAFVIHSLTTTRPAPPPPPPKATILDAFPTVTPHLDEAAQRRVLESDPVRAKDILNEILSRGDYLQNPSAFVMKSLPPPVIHEPIPQLQEQDYVAANKVESMLSEYPHLRARIDSQAVQKMRQSDPVRVQEVLKEIETRGDVRNPSAYVVKALHDFPTPRKGAGGVDAPVMPEMLGQDAMSLYYSQYMLAAQAQAQLMPQFAGHTMAWDPSQLGASQMAMQYQQGLQPQMDMRWHMQGQMQPQMETQWHMQPQMEAQWQAQPQMDTQWQTQPQMGLHGQPHLGMQGQMQPQTQMDMQGQSAAAAVPAHFQPQSQSGLSPVQQMLQLHPTMAAQLDQGARTFLEAVDPARAVEVLEDLISKSETVRNPSAFVAAALAKQRERSHQAERSRSPRRDPNSWLEQALSQHQRLATELDVQARRKLESIEQSKAKEIIEDLARRTDVRNPSAFVVKAANDVGS